MSCVSIDTVDTRYNASTHLDGQTYMVIVVANTSEAERLCAKSQNATLPPKV